MIGAPLKPHQYHSAVMFEEGSPNWKTDASLSDSYTTDPCIFLVYVGRGEGRKGEGGEERRVYVCAPLNSRYEERSVSV